MGKKILDLLEKHVEKIVIGIIGIICLVLLWFFVFSGPHSVKYMNKSVSPGKIDSVVVTQAKRLDEKMNESPEHPPAIQSRVDLFKSKLALSADVIDEHVYLALPGFGDVAPVDDRSYTRPDIPGITDVQVEWYRTVVHMPTEVVDATNRYQAVKTELSDIDLVTVQGTFDLAKLKRNFQNSFNSPLFKADYRSPELANPMFADVQLQRQQLTENGWSEWQTVPRTKADSFKAVISNIPEKMTADYIGGIGILMANYNGLEIQKDIVQPDIYDFGSNLEIWLPPTYHSEFEQLSRQMWDQQKEQRDLARKNARTAGGDGGMGMNTQTTRRTLRKDPRKEQRTIQDVIDDFQTIAIDPAVGLSTLDGSLIIWANDDTVEPENTYRYRIRLGVFNPTAGKGWFEKKEDSDSVVMWSQYTDATDKVTIDPMMYLFPLDMTKDDTAVSIKLAKFYMGNWRTADFDVVPGQTIGGVVDVQPQEDTDEDVTLGMEGGFFGGGRSSQEVITVDFTTDILLVDVVPMTDLVGSNMLRERHYSDVLYMKDQKSIDRMPTKKANWPDIIREKFDDVRAAEEKPCQIVERRSVGGGFNDLQGFGGGMMGEY